MDKSKKIMSAVMLAGMLGTAKAPAKTLEPKAELPQTGPRIEIEQGMPSQNMAHMNDVQKLKAGLVPVDADVVYDDGVTMFWAYMKENGHWDIYNAMKGVNDRDLTLEEACRKYPEMASQLHDCAASHALDEAANQNNEEQKQNFVEPSMGPSREC